MGLKNNKLTYIDIFSGCWGLSLGLHNSWLWRGLFAVEKSPDAFLTLQHNLIKEKKHFSFPNWLSEKSHDINELLKDDNLKALKWKVNLVAGGPPCQGFSLAGRRNKDDIRNSLVYSYIKFIEIVEPDVIFFENVRWFCAPFKDDNEKYAYSSIVVEELKNIGYKDAHFEVIDFSKYGVPQSRNRFIMVATKRWNSKDFFKNLISNKNSFLESKGIWENNTLCDAISDLNQKNWKMKSKDFSNFFMWKYGSIESSYQAYMRKDKSETYPDSHRFPNHKPLTVKKFKTAIKEQLSSEDIKERFNTKKSSTRVLQSHIPSPTLTTLPDDLIHYSEPRILTVREYARIQSFPDTYVFKWKYTTWWEMRKKEVPRYTQIGNAIPPLFWEQSGIALSQLFS